MLKLSASSCIPILHSVGLRSEFGVVPKPAWEIFVTVSIHVPMTGSYDRLEVALSVLIAVSASCFSLDLAGRVPSQNRIAFVNSFCLKLLEARRAEQVISRRSYVNARDRL